MHEVSLMAEAVRLAEDSAQSAGASRIAGVRLRVGRLSGAVPEALRFAWDVVRQNTLAAEAWLEIELVAGACRCAACGIEFACDDFLSVCPQCQQPAGELIRGRELEVAAVETIVEEADMTSNGGRPPLSGVPALAGPVGVGRHPGAD